MSDPRLRRPDFDRLEDFLALFARRQLHIATAALTDDSELIPHEGRVFAEPLVELPALSGRELDAERWDQDGDHCAPLMRRGPCVPG